MANTTLPKDSAERKEIPLYEGVLKYFPAALAAVARVSKDGNDKHNPGQPLHHARGKSSDHASCIMRHLTDLAEDFGHGVGYDEKGGPQVGAIAWRALALCQEWLEKHEGAPLAPGAKLPELSPAEQVLAHEGAFTIGDLVRLPDIKVTYVKRGLNGEYGQERRFGPKDRRQFNVPYDKRLARRNGADRRRDDKPWENNPRDNRVGEADRRKVNNEFIAELKGGRRCSMTQGYGRRKTDTAHWITLPRPRL